MSSDGDTCAVEAVQSLMGEPKPYSIVLTQTSSSVDVTLTSGSGQFECTFRGAAADRSGFTTFGVPGYYDCRADFEITARCSDGTQANLITLFQDVSASISGDDISGQWEIVWGMLRRDPDSVLETSAEFTGRRQ